MVEETLPKWNFILKEIITHIVSLIFIGMLAILLYKKATNPAIEINPLLVSLSSAAFGYYLGRFIKND